MAYKVCGMWQSSLVAAEGHFTVVDNPAVGESLTSDTPLAHITPWQSVYALFIVMYSPTYTLPSFLWFFLHLTPSVATAPVQSQLKPEAEPSLAKAQPELPSDGSHISANSGSG